MGATTSYGPSFVPGLRAICARHYSAKYKIYEQVCCARCARGGGGEEQVCVAVGRSIHYTLPMLS